MKSSTDGFSSQQRVWETFGRDDALWAILSHEDRRRGKWNLEDFFSTGPSDVDRYVKILRHSGWDEVTFQHVLDFGCGVGRLSRAWLKHAHSVTGVDVSSEMARRATAYNLSFPQLKFTVNTEPNLRCFGDDEFDLVFSHICLQHIPPRYSHAYLQEFCRVCRPQGYVVFQVPSALKGKRDLAEIKSLIVNHMPFGLGRLYRKFRRGTTVAFSMYVSPADSVLKLFAQQGLTFLGKHADQSAGETYDSWIYVFRKEVGR